MNFALPYNIEQAPMLTQICCKVGTLSWENVNGREGFTLAVKVKYSLCTEEEYLCYIQVTARTAGYRVSLGKVETTVC